MSSSQHGPHDTLLTAVALMHAQKRRDYDAVSKVLADADLKALAFTLGQLLQAAVQAQGMTVDTFLGALTDRTVEAIYLDGLDEGTDPWSE